MLYEMVSGKLPFTAKDAIGLVHCHISVQPPSLTETRPDIPFSLVSIIEKLLSKNAEDRYQSCNGIKADLALVLSNVQRSITEKVPISSLDSEINFNPGKYDISNKLFIHQVSAFLYFDLYYFKLTPHYYQKLYGREEQVPKLISLFNSISRGQIDKRLLLVHGYSGIGKTTLINEVHKVW